MDVGIAHVITIGAGRITSTFLIFIMISIFVGEVFIETAIGVAINGTTEGFPTNNFRKIGGLGILIDIGKGKGNGTLKNIALFHCADKRN